MIATKQQRGGVSIFIVIFTALIVTVVTASFIQLMMRNQQQASTNDLSQSAYDAAMAGVEDAKRALIKVDTGHCDNACRDNLRLTGSCTQLHAVIGVNFDDNREVQVGSPDDNQAYTCVKVGLDASEVEASLRDEGAMVIPLKSRAQFNKIRLSWFSPGDVTENGHTIAAIGDIPPVGSLPPKSEWGSDKPPMMRLQLIRVPSSNINLASVARDARTMFLHPQADLTGDTELGFPSRDSSETYSPTVADACLTNPGPRGYYCSVVINLGSNVTTADMAYLQLAAIYGGAQTSYEIQPLRNDGTPVSFTGVQAEVDSTGRAGDLFRRVRAKVMVSGQDEPITFPNAALSVRGNVCKDFSVTDNSADYNPNVNPEHNCAP